MPRFSGCVAGNAPIPSKVSATGMPARLGELANLIHRAGDDDSVAGKNHGPLRVVNEIQRLLIFFRLRRKVGTISGQLRLRGIPIKFACSLLRVLSDVDQNRPRTARSRDIESFSDGARDFVGVGDEIVMLRDGQRNAGDVGLLKGVGADQLAANLSRDADDWRRIEHRSGNARDHIGRAGSGRGNGDADFPAGASVTVGHVRRTLLVAHQDVVNLAALERVIGRQNCAAGIAEHVLHALALDAFPKNASRRSCSCQPSCPSFEPSLSDPYQP